jgi:two-component system chemotaxis sensor kinase CheA
MNDQNETFDLNVLREMFKSEAYELLGELESALLALEESPRDKDVIGRVFRALHTIKGSGGACGFEVISHLAHEVEALYDAIRNDKLAVTREIINLTLAARDQITALFDECYLQKPAESEVTEQIINSFQKLLPEGSGRKTKKAEPAAAPAAEDEPLATYRIRFRASRNIFQTGTDPQNLLNELYALGTCRVVAQLGEIPLLDELDPELCYIYWDGILTTNKGLNAIKDVFIFVQDSSEITIEPIESADGLADSEEYKKLGEILVERGDLSPADMQSIQTEQKRFGEILVEKGLVDHDRIESALTEQQHVRDLRRERQRSEEMSSIRVHSHKLDKLVDLVGELVTVQARLTQVATQGSSAVLLSIAEEVERLTAELRDNTMSIRMLPINTIFNKFKRVVRDLSQSLGKDVELVMEGGDTELDKSVIEKLHDPLVHLIRNCIDHGLEVPAERTAQGKPRSGTIRLSAQHSGAYVVIRIDDDGAGMNVEAIRRKAAERTAQGKPRSGTIRLSAQHSGAYVVIRIDDDGAGMNVEAIRRKAAERGLIAADAVLPESELHNLVLLPGFSTAAQVTDVSGRGVGMDVVKQAIDALRGTIEISSTRGKGTSITLKLPLTLAIIDGFLTKIGTDHYVFPLSLVDECVELQSSMAKTGDRDLLNVRGAIVPYIKLRERFGISGERPAIEQVVITKMDNLRVGFVVDHVVGGHQTVIKNLGRMYKGIEGLSGATILGDGSVALILDVPKLIQSVEREETKA